MHLQDEHAAGGPFEIEQADQRERDDRRHGEVKQREIAAAPQSAGPQGRKRVAERQQHQRDREPAQDGEGLVDRGRQAGVGRHQHEGDRNRVDHRRARDFAERDVALGHPGCRP